MSENVAGQAEESLPGLTPPANENPAPVPAQSQLEVAPDKAGLVEKVRMAGQNALETVQTVLKRGRGRPKKDGKAKKSDVVAKIPIGADLAVEDDDDDDDSAGDVASPAPVLPSASPALIARCVSRAAKGFCAPLNYFLKRKKLAEGYTKEQAQEVVESCAPEPDEIEDLKEAFNVAFENAHVDPKVAAKFLAFCAGAGILSRYATAFTDTAKEPEKEEEP